MFYATPRPVLDAVSIALLCFVAAAAPGVARADECDFCDQPITDTVFGAMEPSKCRPTCDPERLHPCLHTCHFYFSTDAQREACWQLYCQGELEACPGFAADDPWEVPSSGGTLATEELFACARHHIPDDPGNLRLTVYGLASTALRADFTAAPGAAPPPLAGPGRLAAPARYSHGAAGLSHGEGLAVSLGYQRRSGSIFEASWARTEAQGSRGHDLELDSYELSYLLPVTPFGDRCCEPRRDQPRDESEAVTVSPGPRRWDLYLLLGAGWQTADGAAASALDVADDSLTVHAGLVCERRLSRRWFLRADARGRYLEATSELVGEGRLGIGLRFD